MLSHFLFFSDVKRSAFLDRFLQFIKELCYFPFLLPALLYFLESCPGIFLLVWYNFCKFWEIFLELIFYLSYCLSVSVSNRPFSGFICNFCIIKSFFCPFYHISPIDYLPFFLPFSEVAILINSYLEFCYQFRTILDNKVINSMGNTEPFSHGIPAVGQADKSFQSCKFISKGTCEPERVTVFVGK